MARKKDLILLLALYIQYQNHKKLNKEIQDLFGLVEIQSVFRSRIGGNRGGQRGVTHDPGKEQKKAEGFGT